MSNTDNNAIKICFLRQFSAKKYMLKFNKIEALQKKVWNMLKVDNKGTKTMPMMLCWCLLFLLCCGVFIVNFEHISYLFPVLLFLTLNK